MVIAKIGDTMAGWGTIEDDMEDMLLSAVNAKKARRRRRLENKQIPKTRPRKVLLLYSHIALFLLSLLDGLIIVTFPSVPDRSTGINVETSALFPVLGAAIAYGWYSFKIQQSPSDRIASSILVKVASAISLVLTLSMLACMLALALMRKSRVSLVSIISTLYAQFFGECGANASHALSTQLRPLPWPHDRHSSCESGRLNCSGFSVSSTMARVGSQRFEGLSSTN